MATLSVIEEWKHKCVLYGKQHDDARAYYRYMNHSLMITSIMLSGLASTTSLSIVSNESNCTGKSNIWLIVLNSVGIFSSVLISIHRFMGISELQQNHDLHSDLYTCLANDITMNVALEGGSKMFHSLDEFMKHCKARLDILIDKAPPIPTFIINKTTRQTAGSESNEQTTGV